MKNYIDIELVCQCGESFTWNAGEQAFLNDLADKGKIPSVQQPKRFPSCRNKRKIERSMQESAQNSNY